MFDPRSDSLRACDVERRSCSRMAFYLSTWNAMSDAGNTRRRATRSGQVQAGPQLHGRPETRTRILGAARELIPNAQVSLPVTAIARHAGVAIQTVYDQFGSKG